MSEILEVFDSLFCHTGEAERKIVHRQGLWHQTFHCWIIRKREDKYYVLFQKRAACKEDFPDMLDIPAAGHIGSKETKEDGVREIKEELGVDINYDLLKHLGIRTEVMESEGFVNKEFQHVYLLEDNTPLSDYTLQEEEVGGLIEVELFSGLKLFFGETDSIECDSIFIENGVKKSGKYTMRMEDVIPRIDGYYKKVFIMAYRYFMGDKYLAI